MIFDTKNTAGKKVEVYSYNGVKISAVKKYNTKTREAVIFLIGEDKKGNKRAATSIKKKTKYRLAMDVVTVKVKLRGSYILVNGKKY
jgi:hypothetical protein